MENTLIFHIIIGHGTLTNDQVGIFTNESSATVLSGFTVTNCSDSALAFFGSSEPKIQNCAITRNRAIAGTVGAAVRAQDSAAPRLLNVTLSHNNARFGGALAARGTAAAHHPLPPMHRCRGLTPRE